MSKVYTEAEVQNYNLAICMNVLKNALCDENSKAFCRDREDREAFIKAYRQYLDASVEYYYLIFNKETSVFSAETRVWSLGTKTEDELDDLLTVVVDVKNGYISLNAKYQYCTENPYEIPEELVGVMKKCGLYEEDILAYASEEEMFLENYLISLEGLYEYLSYEKRICHAQRN